jgi:hypothetical protein
MLTKLIDSKDAALFIVINYVFGKDNKTAKI